MSWLLGNTTAHLVHRDGGLSTTSNTEDQTIASTFLAICLALFAALVLLVPTIMFLLWYPVYLSGLRSKGTLAPQSKLLKTILLILVHGKRKREEIVSVLEEKGKRGGKKEEIVDPVLTENTFANLTHPVHSLDEPDVELQNHPHHHGRRTIAIHHPHDDGFVQIDILDRPQPLSRAPLPPPPPPQNPDRQQQQQQRSQSMMTTTTTITSTIKTRIANLANTAGKTVVTHWKGLSQSIQRGLQRIKTTTSKPTAYYYRGSPFPQEHVDSPCHERRMRLRRPAARGLSIGKSIFPSLPLRSSKCQILIFFLSLPSLICIHVSSPLTRSVSPKQTSPS